MCTWTNSIYKFYLVFYRFFKYTFINYSYIILALLPIGLLLYSISSNFCACIFTWSCSTRTELVQKWSLLVRIRTLVDRISICFFEPGDLLFRSDSGQMEEDLDAVQHVQLNQIIFALEDLLEQHAQLDILLIYKINLIVFLYFRKLNKYSLWIIYLNITQKLNPILLRNKKKPVTLFCEYKLSRECIQRKVLLSYEYSNFK